MKNKPKVKSTGPKVDPYLEGLMAKLLDRLTSLEKKMDAVVAQVKPAQGAAPQPPSRRDRTMYEAVCADCHKVCEVPFRPSEDRAVYCKECFARRKAGGNGKQPHGMPVLTPVAMPPKPVNKPRPLLQTSAASIAAPAKAKKSSPAKKAKKKK